jgi:hypothetical protein
VIELQGLNGEKRVVRSRKLISRVKSPNTIKHNQCKHGFQDLVLDTNPYWCNPCDETNGLFSFNWLNRIKGCHRCNRMFVFTKGRKEWKMPKLIPEIQKLWCKLDDGTLGYDYYEEVEKLRKEEQGIKSGGLFR